MIKYLLLSTILFASSAYARDNIQVAGSSTVLPFAIAAAESFAENTDFPSPVVEGGGTGAGIKKFCSGVGENTIDIATASRQMKDDEKAVCVSNGVDQITEVRIGYDGIVFASDIHGASFNLTPLQVYQAIKADSTFANWNEVDASLPNEKILILIPGTKHGTREVFDQKVMIQGCKDSGDYDVIAQQISDKKEIESKCSAIRADGSVIEIDGDYSETLNRMKSDPHAVGVFGLSFYKNNTASLQVATVNGVEPSVETIASGEYAISRPLYFYVKNANVGTIPGIMEFAQYFISDEVAGPEGLLFDVGLVPDPELAKTQNMLNSN